MADSRGERIYAEVELKERPLTDAERAWCDETFMYRDTERVVEFEMPHPEDLRAATTDQDLTRLHCLDAVIDDADHRHDVLTGLQERLAEEDVRTNQLQPRKGILTDVYPEWHLENDHNDGKSREHLHDLAAMRKDAHLTDFRSIAGFSYAAFWNARLHLLGVHEPKLDPHELCALGVAGYPEWTYCRECGAVAPPKQFLHINLER